MVSQRTRNLVGQSCIDVSRFGLRCEALANRYIRRRDFLRMAMLVAVIGSAASLFTPVSYPVATTVLAVAAAVLALVDHELKLAKKSAVLHRVNVDVGRLEADWNRLWIRLDDEDADDLDVRSEDRSLKGLLIDTAKRLREEGIVLDNNLNRGTDTPMVSAVPRSPSPGHPAPPPRPPAPRPPPQPKPKKQ